MFEISSKGNLARKVNSEIFLLFVCFSVLFTFVITLLMKIQIRFYFKQVIYKSEQILSFLRGSGAFTWGFEVHVILH